MISLATITLVSPTHFSYDAFKKYYLTLSNGQQRILLKDVSRVLQDNWRDSIRTLDIDERITLRSWFYYHKVDCDIRVTVNDVRHSNRQQQRDDKLERLFEPQMFSSVTRELRTFEDRFMGVFSKVSGKIEKSADSITSLTEQFQSIIHDTKRHIGAATSWTPIVMLSLKSLAFGYLIMQEHNRSFGNILALLTLLTSTSSVDALISLTSHSVSDLVRAVKGIVNKFSFRPQNDDTEQTESFIMTLFHLMKSTIGGCFSGITPSQMKSFDLRAKRLKTLSELLKTVNTLWEYMLVFLRTILEWFVEHILTPYGFTLSSDDASIESIINEFNSMQNDDTFKTCINDSIAAKRVLELRSRLMQAEFKMVKAISLRKLKARPLILSHITGMLKFVNNILEKVPPHLKTEHRYVRKKPFFLYTYGEPRIGKSAVWQPIIASELARALKLKSQYEDVANFSHFRNCGAEFWEGYTGQPIVQYNDLFQDFADKQKMHVAMLELTNVIDDNPYNLNFATLENKGQVYFTSDIVIANAQDDIIGKPWLEGICLSGGKHIFARRNIVIRFRLNTKYAGPLGIDAIKVAEEMAKPTTICVGGDKKLFPQDMYWVDFTHPVSGATLKTLYFEDAITEVCNSAKQYFAHQDQFKISIAEYMQHKWTSNAPCRTPQTIDAPPYTPPSTPTTSTTTQTVHYNVTTDQISTTPTQKKKLFSFKPQMDSDEDYSDSYQFSCSQCSIYQRFFLSGLFSVPSDLTREFILDLDRSHDCNVSYDRFNEILAQAYHDDFSNVTELALENLREEVAVEKFEICRRFPWYASVGTALVIIGVLISGFAIYRAFSHKDSAPQTAEGKSQPAKPRFIRRPIREKVQPQAYNQSNEDVHRIIKHNFVVLEFIEMASNEKIARHYTNAYCVKGDVVVAPRHFIDKFHDIREQRGDNGVDFSIRINGRTMKVPLDLIKFATLDYEHLNDICFLKFHRLFMQRDTSRFFQKITDDVNLYGAYLYGLRSHRSDNDSTVSLLTLGSTRLQKISYDAEAIPGSKGLTHHYHIPQGYMYSESMTMTGDCGMLLLNTDDKTNSRKILGMHTAGNVQAAIGFSCPLFQEDIDEAVSFFDKEMGLDTMYIQSELPMIDTVSEMEGDTFDMLQDLKLKVVGKGATTMNESGKVIKYFNRLPSTTKISKSVCYEQFEEDFGPSKMAPARLRTFKGENGEVISPLKNGLSKLGRISQPVSQYTYDEIVDHIALTIETASTPTSKSERVVLDDDQTINGYMAMKALDLSTSPGLPYILEKTGESAGKREWFDQDMTTGKYTMNKVLKDRVYNRIERAKQCEVVETLFADALKDETRPKEKVVAGKTRLFQVGPMDLNIALRKYFGCFISHMQSSFIEGECAVGVNPNSTQWKTKLKDFETISRKFVNGDYKNYDSTLAFQICMVLAEVANLWYDDGEENARVRRTLLASCLSTYHIVGDFIFHIDQGNPSGINMTSVLNCIVNSFLFRLAYIRTTGQRLTTFNDHIRAWFYGDDNLAAVHSDIQDTFTMKSLEKFFASIGMEYTAATKGEITTDFVDIDDIEFLKRRFVKVGTEVLAPLEKDVVYEIPRWSESDPTLMIDQMQRFNSMLLEVSNYGKKQFNVDREKIIKICKEMRNASYDIDLTKLFTYDQARSICNEFHFSTQSGTKLFEHTEYFDCEEPEEFFDCIDSKELYGHNSFLAAIPQFSEDIADSLLYDSLFYDAGCSSYPELENWFRWADQCITNTYVASGMYPGPHCGCRIFHTYLLDRAFYAFAAKPVTHEHFGFTRVLSLKEVCALKLKRLKPWYLLNGRPMFSEDDSFDSYLARIYVEGLRKYLASVTTSDFADIAIKLYFADRVVVIPPWCRS